jgi:hypothetical protein
MNASAAIEGGWTKGLGPAARGDLHGWKHRFDHVRLMGHERTGGRGRLARIIHDGSSRNRAVATRDRRAEP